MGRHVYIHGLDIVLLRVYKFKLASFFVVYPPYNNTVYVSRSKLNCMMETLSLDHRSTLADAPLEFKECVSYLISLKFSECKEVVADSFKLCSGTTNHHQGPRCARTCNQNDFIISEPPSSSKRLQDANSTPLATPEDHFWLSELQCFLRSECCEFFRASASHKTSPLKRTSSSSNRARIPVSEGRIGIRCTFCGTASYHQRAPQAISFPSTISGIYSAVVMMQLRHFPKCHLIPEQARIKLEMAKRGTSAASSSTMMDKHSTAPTFGRQQYWMDSAHELGLVDTDDGIRCFMDPNSVDRKRSHASRFSENHELVTHPLSNRHASKRVRCSQDNDSKFDTPGRSTTLHHVSQSSVQKNPIPVVSPNLAESSEIRYVDPVRLETLSSLIGKSELVLFMEDVDLVPDYLLIALGQLVPCLFEEWDRVGCYKDRPTGFKGLCCKHCRGEQGHGKFFPASIGGISQTTTAQTILKHVAYKCDHCPKDIRQAVLKFEDDQSLKECRKRPASISPATTKDAKPKYGSRKFFFQRLWSRLHGEAAPSNSM